MRKITCLIGIILSLSLVFGSVCYAVTDTGSFTVTNPGPLSSLGISTYIYNNDTFDLLSAHFDSSGTTASGGGGGSLVFGGLGGSVTDPAGGTSAFTQDSATQWHFDFTSFNFGDSFMFGWDPDTATEPNYGASVAELAGLSVMLVTTGGNVSGTRDGF